MIVGHATDAAFFAPLDAAEDDDREFSADVRLGEANTPAVATWSWDGGGVCLLSVRLGPLVLSADDLSDAARAHLCLQIAQSLPEDAYAEAVE